MQVGVIGLGNIGGHVAANLVADGHDVVVFDVDAGRAEGVTGARPVKSVGDVGAASEVTVLSLPTPTVVRLVADEWATTAAPGSVLVDLSTNSPEVVRELGTRLTATGHHLVEAPSGARCRSWSAVPTTPSRARNRCSSPSGARSCTWARSGSATP